MQGMIDFINSNSYIGKAIWSVVWLVLGVIIVKLIHRFLYKKIPDNTKYYLVKKRVTYSAGFILTLIIILIWSDSISNLTTYIGLLSAGIAIALKEVFTNFAGWIYISLKKPFEAGHRISISETKGDVIDINMFQFSLMEVSSFEDGEQSTGRIIDIPNHYILTYPLINYTKGFEYIWNEIKVLITFESDWELAKKLLTEIVIKDSTHLTNEIKTQISNAAKKYMINYQKLTPIVYTDVKDCGVQLTLRYLCVPKKRRIIVNKIWEDILLMLTKEKTIELAYPTKRVVD